jgi:hypothetical protein
MWEGMPDRIAGRPQTFPSTRKTCLDPQHRLNRGLQKGSVGSLPWGTRHTSVARPLADTVSLHWVVRNNPEDNVIPQTNSGSMIARTPHSGEPTFSR